VDFLALNAVSHRDSYSLPIFEDTFWTLYGSRYYRVLYGYSGYWQVQLAEEDKPKTAFSTPQGLFHFVRLPSGIQNGPSNFQRLMDIVLKELIGSEAWVYLDYIIVFSKSIEKHAEGLEHVLQRFERANFQLKAEKCAFAQGQVNYLGYVVSRDGLKACPEKTAAVR
jgi:hypothetical protein